MSPSCGTVGVLGGGQLARMLALAGVPMGLRFVFLEPAVDACAAAVGEHLCAAYDDAGALAELAARVDVVTFEFENVPAAVPERLAEGARVHPGGRALAVAQDRVVEKEFFTAHGIPTPAFAAVDSAADLDVACRRVGLPLVLKTRRLGYDGKGQAVARTAADLPPAWNAIGGQPAIAEALVRFRREVSMLAVRGQDGAHAFYPLVENEHGGGILRCSVARAGDPLEAQARDYAGRLLDALDYVGVLALELFDAGGELMANEFAPRVHNSGHWTIEGAETSQFENHLRAVLGMPLGATTLLAPCAMVNCIGAMPDAAAVLAVAGAHLHDYRKQPRAGRKLGHVTLRAADAGGLADAVATVRALVARA